MFSPAGICVCICVSAPRRIAETKNGSFYPPCFPISPTVRPNPPFSKCCSQMFGKSCPLNLSSNSLGTSSQTRTCLPPSALLPFPSLQIIQTPLHSIIVLLFLKYTSTIRHTFLHMCVSQQFLWIIPLSTFSLSCWWGFDKSWIRANKQLHFGFDLRAYALFLKGEGSPSTLLRIQRYCFWQDLLRVPNLFKSSW